MNETLQTALGELFGAKLARLDEYVGELTIEVKRADLIDVMRALRDQPSLYFEQLLDLCGVDYLDYADGAWDGPRFAVVYHLLSVRNNQRLRVRVYADDDFPVVASVIDIWPSANWYEREAFDLYGIVFEGHPDLRRLLTDYGFIGHPFRKDFPLVGNVEMRYDPEQQRVIYQPVTIEQRILVPRIVREDQFSEVK